MLTSYFFLKKYIASQKSYSLIKTISKIFFISSCVSVAGLILILSVMNYFSGTVDQRLLRGEPHFVISASSIKKSKADIMDRLYAMDKKIKSLPSVRSSFLVQENDIILKKEHHNVNVVARGLLFEDFKLWMKTFSLNDGLLNEMFFHKKELPLVIGERLSFKFDIYSGEDVLLFETSDLLGSLEEISYKQAYIAGEAPESLSASKQFFVYYPIQNVGVSRVSESKVSRVFLEVKVEDPIENSKVEKTIKHMVEVAGLDIKTWRERNALLFLALRMEKSIMALFFILSLVISCFTLMTFMVLLILYKKDDIRTLYFLGVTKKNIRNLFIKMGFVMSLSGMCLGLLIGVGLSLALEFYPLPLLSDLYINRNISAKIEMHYIVIGLAAILGLGWLGSWLPVKASLK